MIIPELADSCYKQKAKVREFAEMKGIGKQRIFLKIHGFRSV